MQGYDDAQYLVLAKSLAAGRGYRLIASPDAPVSTYAPGYPALLAPIWWLKPTFPDGVVFFKIVSVIAALLTIPFLYRFLKDCKGLERGAAGLIVLMTALSPLTVYYTSRLVMTEPTYILFSVFALLLLSSCLEEKRFGWQGFAATAILLTSSYFIRTVGITLLLAGTAYLLLQRRWWQALSLALFFGLFVAPWFYRNLSLGGLGLAPDTYQHDLLLRDYAHPELGMISSYWELLPRLFLNAHEHITTSLPQLLLPALTGDRLLALLESLGLSGLRALTGWSFAGLSVLGYWIVVRRRVSTLELYVFFYIGMILLPSWAAARNLVPILPFILYYLYTGLRVALDHLARLIPGGSILSHRWAFVPLFAAMLISFLASDRHLVNEGLAYRSRGIDGTQAGIAAAATWLLANSPPDALLSAKTPWMLYLYTDRLAVDLPGGSTSSEAIARLRTAGVDYVVSQPHRVPVAYEQPEPPVMREWATLDTGGLERVFSVEANPQTFVYRVVGTDNLSRH